MRGGFVFSVEGVVADENFTSLMKAKGGAGNGVNGVVLDGDGGAALIEEHAIGFGPTGIDGDVVNGVASKVGVRLEAQGVDATSVGEFLHDVVDVVGDDEVIARGGGGGTPPPAEGDAGVREISEFVAGEAGFGGDPDPDCDGAVVEGADVSNEIAVELDPL